MEKLVVVDSSLHVVASKRLRRDLAWMSYVIAMVSRRKEIRSYMMEKENTTLLELVVDYTQRRCVTYETFISVILWTQRRFQHFNVPLWKLVGEYLDVPTDQEYRLLEITTHKSKKYWMPAKRRAEARFRREDKQRAGR